MANKNNKLFGMISLTIILVLIFSTVAEAVVLRGSRTGALKSPTSSVSKSTKSVTLSSLSQSTTKKLKKSAFLTSTTSSTSSSSNFKASKTSKLKKASGSTLSVSSSSLSSSSSYSSPSKGRGDQASVMTASRYEELMQRMQRGEKRIILRDAYTESEVNNLVSQEGCSEPIHKFDEFISLVCPTESIANLRNVVDDSPTYHEVSLQSNAQIKADLVHAANYDGSGITVAIIDNGVDRNNPEIADSIVDVVPFGFTNTEDETGHGTIVAGIITANGVDSQAKGVAPGSDVFVAKVSGPNGGGSPSDIWAAIDYIVNNNKAKIISISLGGGNFEGADCDDNLLAQKINWAADRGVVVIAAAGNDGLSGLSAMACGSGAIGVGAVDSNNNRVISNYGASLDLMAPGANVYVTTKNNQYGPSSGTSISTPHVAGVVALLKDAMPSLSVGQIKDALYHTATDKGDPGFDIFYGHGVVNAKAALDSVMNTPQSVEITASDVNDAEVGLNYNSDVQIREGASPYTATISQGALPSGLTINNNGIISGTPGNSGQFTFTVEVKDNTNVKITKQFTMQVYNAPSIITECPSAAKYGRSYSAQFEGTGGLNPYSWSITSGNLPLGLTLDSSTGAITGVPAECGKIKFKITAQDMMGGTSSLNCKLKVKACPEFAALTYDSSVFEEGDSVEEFYSNPDGSESQELGDTTQPLIQ